jgi:hypothetical protein
MAALITVGRGSFFVKRKRLRMKHAGARLRRIGEIPDFVPMGRQVTVYHKTQHILVVALRATFHFQQR